MDGKPVFSQLKGAVADYWQALEKNSVATGVVAGVGVTLAVSVLVPDTAKTFVDELRGRRRHGHKQEHHRDKAPPETFAAKTDESRKAPDQVKTL